MSSKPATAALHSQSTIFSTRHMPAWFLLAFAAGSVNAGAFLACKRFVTHVTGTTTRLGLVGGHWLLWFDYGLVLACFILGAGAAVTFIEGRHHRGKTPLYALPLLLVAASVAFVAIAGRMGTFGPFGETVETAGDFLMLAVLSFAMGLQNASVASTTAGAIRTTHMTGPATDLGVSLATVFFASGEVRRNAWRLAGLRFGKLASFILGGAIMVPLAARAQYLAFFLPCVVIVLCAAISFVPAWMPSRQSHEPQPAT